jgi:hypothetical protein
VTRFFGWDLPSRDRPRAGHLSAWRRSVSSWKRRNARTPDNFEARACWRKSWARHPCPWPWCISILQRERVLEAFSDLGSQVFGHGEDLVLLPERGEVGQLTEGKEDLW